MMLAQPASADGGAAATLLERRWFAAFTELEALRDALGEELLALDQSIERSADSVRAA